MTTELLAKRYLTAKEEAEQAKARLEAHLLSNSTLSAGLKLVGDNGYNEWYTYIVQFVEMKQDPKTDEFYIVAQTLLCNSNESRVFLDTEAGRKLWKAVD